MKFVGQSLKAFYAAASAFLAGLGTVLVGPTQSISDVTTAQWVWIAGATLGAFAATYGVTNKPK